MGKESKAERIRCHRQLAVATRALEKIMDGCDFPRTVAEKSLEEMFHIYIGKDHTS